MLKPEFWYYNCPKFSMLNMSPVSCFVAQYTWLLLLVGPSNPSSANVKSRGGGGNREKAKNIQKYYMYMYTTYYNYGNGKIKKETSIGML